MRSKMNCDFLSSNIVLHVGNGLCPMLIIENYQQHQLVSHLNDLITRKFGLSLKITSPQLKFMKSKIRALSHEANEWLTSGQERYFKLQGQLFTTAEAHIVYWCRSSKSSEFSDSHEGLSSKSSATFPPELCVPLPNCEFCLYRVDWKCNLCTEFPHRFTSHVIFLNVSYSVL